MVSGGFSGERDKARYRRRKPIPAIVIAALLGVAAVVVWTKVIAKDGDVNAAVTCSAPTAATAANTSPAPSAASAKSAGTALPYNALDKVNPAPAGDVQVRVYNASSQRGAAQNAQIALQQAGFTVLTATNDPVYPNEDMKCRGQIRFGTNGEAAARTVSLAVPCTQLIRDNRQDATVDLALGSSFSSVTPNGQAQDAMKQLAAWGQAHPQPQGGQQAANLYPQLNTTLLDQAHTTQC